MPIFEISSQNGCLFLRGAYFHGVLINTCDFLLACSCDIFSPRRSFPALSNAYSCSRIGNTVGNRSIDATPAHQRKVLGTNESVRVFFSNFWICFIKRPCLDFGLYPMSIACLQLQIDTGKH